MVEAEMGAYGPGIIWTGSLNESLLAAVEATKAVELRLYRDNLIPMDAFEILRELPQLVGLSVSPNRRLASSDWDVIHGLTNLRYLHHSGDQVSGTLSLENLPCLEWLSMPWWPGLRGLAETNLFGLLLRKWKSGKPASRLPETVRALGITQGDEESAVQASCLPRLQHLTLAKCRGVHSLAELSSLSELRELSLIGLRSLEAVGSQALPRGLRVVDIEDCPRLKAVDLAALQDLKGFFVLGSTGLRTQDVILPTHDRLTHVRVPSLARLAGIEEKGADDHSVVRPPDYKYRMRCIRRYSDVVQLRHARSRLYPDWFREAFPERCIE